MKKILSQIKEYRFHQIVTLILLFLGCMNFKNMYLYFIFGAIFVFLIFNGHTVKIDVSFVLLVLFSISYIIFYSSARQNVITIMKQFTYPACYLIGLNFYQKAKSSNQNINNQIFCLVAMGSFIHYVLNMIINFDSINRNTVDIWTGEIINATGQAAFAVMAIGIFVAFLFYEKRPLLKIVSFIGLGIVIIYNFVLAGRTLFFMILIVWLSAFLFLNRSMNLKNKFRMILNILLVAVLILFIYNNNYYGLQDWVQGTNLYNRFETGLLLDTLRTERKKKYIMNMLKYPFGNGELRRALGGIHAHGLYLDIYSDVGIFGYVIICFFMIRSFFTFFKVIKKKEINKETKTIIWCMYVVLFIEFGIEPIIQGIPWMFAMYCLFCGLTKALHINVKEEKLKCISR